MMRIAVGSQSTGVTEADAANGRDALTDYLSNWWLKAATEPSVPSVIDVSWGAMKCQIELRLDENKSPQVLLSGQQSAPRSITEVLTRFLSETCQVKSVDDHLHIDIKERFINSLTSRAGVSMEMDTKALIQRGMFGRQAAPSNGPKPDLESSTPKIKPGG